VARNPGSFIRRKKMKKKENPAPSAEPLVGGEVLPNAPTSAHLKPSAEPLGGGEVLPLEAQQAAAESFELGTALGTAMTAAMLEKMCAAARIRAFEEARKSKAYKNFPVQFPSGKCAVAHNIHEFCQVVFGQSYRVLAEESHSLARLGEDVYSIVKQLNLPRANVRLLLELPEDEREELQSAIGAADGDKSEVASIIHDLVDKLTVERKRVADAQKTIEAKDSVLKIKEQRISALEEEDARRGAGGRGIVGNDPADEDDDIDSVDGPLLEAEKEVRDSVMEVKKTLTLVYASIAALRRAANAAGDAATMVDCDEVTYHACRDVIAAARRLARDLGVPLIINPDADDTTEDVSGVHMPVDAQDVDDEFWRKEYAAARGGADDDAGA
jgi:hypothetical protein